MEGCLQSTRGSEAEKGLQCLYHGGRPQITPQHQKGGSERGFGYKVRSVTRTVMLKDSQAQEFGYGVLYRPRNKKCQDHTPQKMLGFSLVLVCQ